MKILLVQELSAEVLNAYASLVADADVCIALRAMRGEVAGAALQQGRWRIERLDLFDRTIVDHAGWVQRVMDAQVGPDSSRGEAASLVAYGLEYRLRLVALAHAHVTHAAQEHGCPLDRVDLRVVGSDPYLRDSLRRRRGVISRLRSASLHGEVGRALVRASRERGAANRAVRESVRFFDRARLIARRPREAPVAPTGRTAAFFVLSERVVDLSRPVRTALLSRGWHVPVITHAPGSADPDVQTFGEAWGRAGRMVQGWKRPPAWVIDDVVMADSKVSPSWLRVALSASWLTGWDQIVRHRCLLEALRPNLVVTYSPDTTGLALKAAADSLDIPSVFVHHGPQSTVAWPWFYQWSASALAGQPCVELNRVGLLGERRTGLVAVGHPPYDAMLLRAEAAGSTRTVVRGVGQPTTRPCVVVVFAEFGHHYWVHVFQRRLLNMVAAALPLDCYLVCKLHPSGEDERAVCEDSLSALLPRDAFTVVGERQYTTPDLLAASHVAVATEQSMTLTDAIVMGCPPVAVRFPEMPPGSNDLSHPARGPMFRKCSRVVSNAGELRDALTSLTRDAGARERLLEPRRAYLEAFYVAADGQSAERVADLIDHVDARRSVETLVARVGPCVLRAEALP